MTSDQGSDVGPAKGVPEDVPVRPVSDDPVLPDTTSDERPEGWGERTGDDDPDDLDRFLRERPPHHGD